VRNRGTRHNLIRLSVGGLRLPKVLKNTINNLFEVEYRYRTLRTRSEAIHNMKSMVGTKVESVLKLRTGKLWLSSRKQNRLKEEKAI
jgi:hypothetical protein